MPVTSYQIPEGVAADGSWRGPGARVLLFTCEGCGGPAMFGLDCNLRAAIAAGDPRLAGRWFCGWVDGAPGCVSRARAQLGLFDGAVGTGPQAVAEPKGQRSAGM